LYLPLADVAGKDGKSGPTRVLAAERESGMPLQIDLTLDEKSPRYAKEAARPIPLPGEGRPANDREKGSPGEALPGGAMNALSV